MKKFNFCLLFCLLYALVLTAQQKDSSYRVPILNNHKFLFLNDVRSPYTDSKFNFRIGLGTTDLFNEVSVQFEDTTLSVFNSELSYIDFRIEYNQQIKDWISIYVEILVTARVGTDVESIILQGLNTLESREIGWLFHLSKSKKHLLSGSLRIRNAKATFIDLPEYIEDLLAGQPYASLEQDIPVLVFGSGLLFAYGINETVGFSAEAQLVYGETLVRGGDQFQYFLAGSFDFDMNPLVHIPISFALGGYINTISDMYSFDSSLLSTGNLKINYTGSKAFQFGIEGYRGFTPVDEENKRVGVSGFNFNISLFF